MILIIDFFDNTTTKVTNVDSKDLQIIINLLSGASSSEFNNIKIVYLIDGSNLLNPVQVWSNDTNIVELTEYYLLDTKYKKLCQELLPISSNMLFNELWKNTNTIGNDFVHWFSDKYDIQKSKDSCFFQVELSVKNRKHIQSMLDDLCPIMLIFKTPDNGIDIIGMIPTSYENQLSVEYGSLFFTKDLNCNISKLLSTSNTVILCSYSDLYRKEKKVYSGPSQEGLYKLTEEHRLTKYYSKIYLKILNNVFHDLPDYNNPEVVKLWLTNRFLKINKFLVTKNICYPISQINLDFDWFEYDYSRNKYQMNLNIEEYFIVLTNNQIKRYKFNSIYTNPKSIKQTSQELLFRYTLLLCLSKYVDGFPESFIDQETKLFFINNHKFDKSYFSELNSINKYNVYLI